MKLLVGTAVTFMLMVGLAAAAQGEICYSSPVPETQVNLLSNATPFSCQSLGVVTIPQIYQQGGKVVYLSQEPLDPLPDQPGMDDPPSGRLAWMILIERP